MCIASPEDVYVSNFPNLAELPINTGVTMFLP